MKLSHSAKEMYKQCPMKWKLHYKERLRSTKIGSALLFGSAFDDALNGLLLTKKKNLTPEELEMSKAPTDIVFGKSLQYTHIAGEYVDIRKSSQAEYFKSDLDLSFLEAIDIKSIQEFANEMDIVLSTHQDLTNFIEECQIEMKKGLDDTTQRVYNYTCWKSLFRKGLMMIEAYKTQVMPQIEEVYEIQKKVSLPDGDDEVIGYIDLICSFVDQPGVRYVCDNKTSSRPFTKDSVSTSEQLACYSEYEGNDKCAYIVVEKKIRVREPRVRCNIIKDTMPSKTVNETFDSLTNVFHGVNECKFEKDMEDNNCFQYGRKCTYYNHCRTGDLKNLKYVKERTHGGKEKTNNK